MPWTVLACKTSQSLRNALVASLHKTRSTHGQPVMGTAGNGQTPMPEPGQPGVSAGTGAARLSESAAGDMGQQELLRLTTQASSAAFGQPWPALALTEEPGASPPQGLLPRLSTLHGMCLVTPAIQRFLTCDLWSQKGWSSLFHTLLNVSNSSSTLQEPMIWRYFYF